MRTSRFVPWALLALLPSTGLVAQDNWPQWRGPTLNGVSKSTGLPLEWSAEKNVNWKAELPSWSGATPIVWGDHIFVMSPSKLSEEDAAEREARRQRELEERGGNRGRRRGGRGGGRGGRSGASLDPGGEALLLLCLDRKDGNVRWRREVDEGNALFRKGNNASPSPVTDGRHVWVVTGNGVVTAFDFDGAKQWSFDLQKEFGQFGLGWGYASSPLLHDGKLFIEVLHGRRTDDPSYIVALDGASGELVWREERPTDALSESPDAYTTPTLFEVDGTTQLVVSGGDYVTGHDPATGEELWRAGGLNPRKARNYRIVASPVAIDGMVYAPSRVRPLLALKMGEAGVIDDESVAWRWDDTGAPDVPTPVCDGTHFYMVNDRGMVTCLDAKTGAVRWGPERTVSGTVSSSPFLAEGRLYFTTEEGITAVVAAAGGETFKLLASNELDGARTLSSPVPVGSHILIRTATHLYCVGESD